MLCACDGTLVQPDVVAHRVGEGPVLDEAALVARGLSYRSTFRQVSSRYDSRASAGARVVVWASDDAVAEYPRIDPDAQGSHEMIPEGAMIAREVFDAQGTLTKLTFVAQGPAGYNPQSGDLWFAVATPRGELAAIDGMSQHGALTSCSGCHAGRAMDGFLFGVPRDARVDAEVTPRLPLDGLSLVNAESALQVPLALPLTGMQLAPGQVLLIARDASRAEFEASWGVTLADDVAFLDAHATAGQGVPIINGGEVWELRDASDAVLDGPTVPGRVGAAVVRSASGWALYPQTAASPGVVAALDGLHGLRITEWSDAADSRAQFVELVWVP